VRWSHSKEVAALDKVSLGEVKSVGLGNLLDDILGHGAAE
jgi:hypothetical protein